jgi:hypothetical protein
MQLAKDDPPSLGNSGSFIFNSESKPSPAPSPTPVPAPPPAEEARLFDANIRGMRMRGGSHLRGPIRAG